MFHMWIITIIIIIIIIIIWDLAGCHVKTKTHL